MEEAKPVLESISRIQFYQMIRSQIEHEDNLINQRLSWFFASQAFLFSAYAILLNAPPNVRLQNFATQQETLFYLIPLVAIGVSILRYITVTAAMLAMAKLRRLLSHMTAKESLLLPPVQGYRQTMLLGQVSPILMLFLFAVEKGETEGFMKVLVDAETKEILGASLLGIECDEVIHSILDVMYAKGRIR